MPCKTPMCQSIRETCRNIGKHNRCWRIYENPNGKISSQESWRSYSRKRHEFIESLQFSAQIHSNASSNENTGCESSSGEKGKNRENTRMDESQKQKWGDRWSKEWCQKHTLCIVDGSLSSQKFGVGTTVSEIQRSSRTPRWHCEGCFRIVCCICWAGIISITNDDSKSHGCHIKTTRMRKTSCRRSIRLHPGQNGRCTIVIKKIPSQNVQTLGFVYQSTNGQNHGPVWKIQSFLLNEIWKVIF